MRSCACYLDKEISFYAKESVHPARFCKKGHDAKEVDETGWLGRGTGGLWNGWVVERVGCRMGGLWSGWAVERVGCERVAITELGNGWAVERVGCRMGGLGNGWAGDLGNYLVKSSVSSV